MDIKDYCPHIIDKRLDIIDKQTRYAEMLVELRVCPICDIYMLPEYKVDYRHSIFPIYIPIDYNAQLKRAGWGKMSSITVDDIYICEECANAGKADFLCALCKERKPSNKEEESYGDPPESLCSDCYETVPAKVWEEKKDELYTEHRYDFE